jgi:transposase
MAYLQKLRQIIAERGSKDIVYVDESGFEPDVCRRYGWGLRGQKVYGDHSGNRRPRTSLIAARRGKDFLAPMIFSGTADTDLVNDWTRHMLCKELRPASTIIWDNAAFHKKKDLEAIASQHGHHILFLPPYSPDFSPIENDFANIKKRRQYAPLDTPIADIIQSYGNYCE